MPLSFGTFPPGCGSRLFVALRSMMSDIAALGFLPRARVAIQIKCRFSSDPFGAAVKQVHEAEEVFSIRR
jgi:hypothetical protein